MTQKNTKTPVHHSALMILMIRLFHIGLDISLVFLESINTLQCNLLKWDVPSNFANSCFCSLVSLVLISSLVRWSHWSPCAQKSGPGGPLDFLFRTILFDFLTICVWICSWLRFRLALCLLKKQLEIPAQWPLATQQIFSSRKHTVIEKLKCC